MSTSGETPDHVPVARADDLRADIINTRAELASTIDHLMAKTDVKTRARHQMTEVKSTLRQRVDQLPAPAQRAVDRITPLAKRARPYGKQIATAVVAVVVVAVVLRRYGG